MSTFIKPEQRALDNHYDFLLATEMNAAEKFDDVVFRYTEQGETHYRFLQAKHRQEESQHLTLHGLTNQSAGDFSLSKYFDSYLKIKDKSEFQDSNCFKKQNILEQSKQALGCIQK